MEQLNSNYKSGLEFRRTPAEKADQLLSWQRPDQAFFAAGACHILAFQFLKLHPGEGYKIIHIQPNTGYSGHHVYVTNGEWAFDHNGWTKEEELLSITQMAYQSVAPGWDYSLKEVTESLEEFCHNTNHRLPQDFAYLPWERATSYINTFPISPVA